MIPEIGDRVKQIRTNFNLSQQDFGSSLGVSRDVINNVERSRTKKVPDPLLKLICATYNINYGWLMSGKGKMNPPNEEKSIIGMIDDLLEDNETAKKVFRAFTEFSEEDWKTVQKFIDTLKK